MVEDTQIKITASSLAKHLTQDCHELFADINDMILEFIGDHCSDMIDLILQTIRPLSCEKIFIPHEIKVQGQQLYQDICAYIEANKKPEFSIVLASGITVCPRCNKGSYLISTDDNLHVCFNCGIVYKVKGYPKEDEKLPKLQRLSRAEENHIANKHRSKTWSSSPYECPHCNYCMTQSMAIHSCSNCNNIYRETDD